MAVLLHNLMRICWFWKYCLSFRFQCSICIYLSTLEHRLPVSINSRKENGKHIQVVCTILSVHLCIQKNYFWWTGKKNLTHRNAVPVPAIAAIQCFFYLAVKTSIGRCHIVTTLPPVSIWIVILISWMNGFLPTSTPYPSSLFPAPNNLSLVSMNPTLLLLVHAVNMHYKTINAMLAPFLLLPFCQATMLFLGNS